MYHCMLPQLVYCTQTTLCPSHFSWTVLSTLILLRLIDFLALFSSFSFLWFFTSVWMTWRNCYRHRIETFPETSRLALKIFLFSFLTHQSQVHSCLSVHINSACWSNFSTLGLVLLHPCPGFFSHHLFSSHDHLLKLSCSSLIDFRNQSTWLPPISFLSSTHHVRWHGQSWYVYKPGY